MNRYITCENHDAICVGVFLCLPLRISSADVQCATACFKMINSTAMLSVTAFFGAKARASECVKACLHAQRA